MQKKPRILVTGANGQLGKEIRKISADYPAFEFHFLSREDLPIHHFELVRNFFNTLHPDYCINCAAYTAVDNAESEPELADLVNGEAPGVLAAVCRESRCRLIHISTDYVFDGQSPVPYKEDDTTNPLNRYGESKLKGELNCRKYNPDCIIIRTAWVYSEFGKNFVKTMLRLLKEREWINVVNDQVGAPTCAADLAEAILDIIRFPEWRPGIYHYSNKGRISWYDFAVAIGEETGSTCLIKPVATSEYPTAARRPAFSLLDTSKIRHSFGLTIPNWRESLRKCLRQLQAAGEK